MIRMVAAGLRKKMECEMEMISKEGKARGTHRRASDRHCTEADALDHGLVGDRHEALGAHLDTSNANRHFTLLTPKAQTQKAPGDILRAP